MESERIKHAIMGAPQDVLFNALDYKNITYEIQPDKNEKTAAGMTTSATALRSSLFWPTEYQRIAWLHFNKAYMVEKNISMLRIHVQLAAQMDDEPTSQMDVRLWLMTTDWNPDTLTWNTQPAPAGGYVNFTADLTVDPGSPFLPIAGSFTQNKAVLLTFPVVNLYYGLVMQCGALSDTTQQTGEMRDVYGYAMG